MSKCLTQCVLADMHPFQKKSTESKQRKIALILPHQLRLLFSSYESRVIIGTISSGYAFMIDAMQESVAGNHFACFSLFDRYSVMLSLVVYL